MSELNENTNEVTTNEIKESVPEEKNIITNECILTEPEIPSVCSVSSDPFNDNPTKSKIIKKKNKKAPFPLKGESNYIDHLDEDPEIDKFRFIILTYISPEGIRGTQTRAIKIRDYAGGRTKDQAYEKAKLLCEKYRKLDEGKFDTFVVEVGKFCSLRTDQYQDINYAEAELNDLVKGHKESIEKSKKAHENRINEIKALQKDDERTKAIKERLKAKHNSKHTNNENMQERDAMKEEMKDNYSKMLPASELVSLSEDPTGLANNAQSENLKTVDNKMEATVSKKRHHKKKKINNEASEEIIKKMEEDSKLEIDRINSRALELNKYGDRIRDVEEQAESSKELYTKITKKQVEEPIEVRQLREVYEKFKKNSK
jgi:hypothetical protein